MPTIPTPSVSNSGFNRVKSFASMDSWCVVLGIETRPIGQFSWGEFEPVMCGGQIDCGSFVANVRHFGTFARIRDLPHSCYHSSLANKICADESLCTHIF